MAHYYKPTGELVSHVPYADGRPGERECTLADARKQSLFPSVTTILSLLAKPQLTDWMVEQGILHAFAAVAPSEADVKSIKQAAFQQVADAAAFGTEVHKGISMGLAGETYWPTDLRVKLVLDGFWPWWMAQGFKEVSSEISFVDEELGLAGTADVVAEWNGRPLLLDFKTQAAETVADFNFYDPDHPLQMAGYSLGLHGRTLIDGTEQRMSVLISRTKPGLIHCKVWQDNMRYDQAFLSLLDTWCLLKSYDPRLATNLPANVIRLARAETGEE